jgi:hypothetical protein
VVLMEEAQCCHLQWRVTRSRRLAGHNQSGSSIMGNSRGQ